MAFRSAVAVFRARTAQGSSSDGRPRHFRLKRGLDIPLAGAPEARIDASPVVTRVAHVGTDCIGVKRLPSLEIEVGDRVRLGEPISRRKAYREIAATAPGSGVVEAIHRGPRRVLETIVIRLDHPRDGDDPLPPTADQETFNAYQAAELDTLNGEQVRENLLASGSWLALRTRPFGMIPPPDSSPAALFVTAIDTHPLAPDPAIIIDDAGEAFADGLRVLGKLTDGPRYCCQRPGAALPVPATSGFQVAAFAGPHPAGLPGTHIHLLAPVSLERAAWYIGYQDVIEIGRLFRSGRLDPTRVIGLAGPMVANPRLIRTRLGASTNDLVQGELSGRREARVISGSVLGGRHAVGTSAFLGRFHNQITVLAEEREREWFGWLKPGRGRYSALNLFWSGRARGEALPLGTSQHGSPRAMVPIGAYERVMPLDLLPTQLLRALLVDDIETAEALGALELEEDDLALCSFVDCGKHDFGPVLRRNLNKIWHESH
ncbi:Na(+)-translocating NADH-quinone reductase subunit A [Halochromatium salexigens]|uniref:Na(+)-translocating NADH-quinone reductase subunit A n=1 Tax=Halochromatium salexigens TaxID=49447 RepID=A0AAJ0XGJ6_HALSE|nr:Na(+)-translocating NADH-quinone reductase subunit A [Halochromatium salexigens]MBK5931156.1 NADH:ubiquinone reductase (Na(+)-transporting) subunit A [Halochromatium salexigens]